MRIAKDPRTHVYRAHYKDAAGAWRSVSLGKRSRPEAEAEAKARGIEELETLARLGVSRREIIARVLGSTPETLEECLKLWVESLRCGLFAPATVASYEMLARGALAHKGESGTPLLKLAPWEPDRGAIAAALRSRDDSASTLKNRHNAVKSLFAYVQAEGWRRDNPAAQIRGVALERGMPFAKREPRKVLRVAESEKDLLLAAAERLSGTALGFFEHAIALAWWTGMRLSDIAALERSSLREDGIVAWTMKSGQRVMLPYAHPLIGSVELRRAVRGLPHGEGRYVFPRQADIVQDPARRSALSIYFRRLCVSAGVEGKTFHGFRHAFKARLHEAGVAIEDIAVLMGHADEQTTAGYGNY